MNVKGFLRGPVAAALTCLVLAVPEAGAQSKDAFMSGSIGLIASVDVASGAFQDRWGRRPALGATFRSPFHIGTVEAGVMLSRHPAATPFTSVLGFAGWGATLPLGRSAGWTATIMAGDYLMLFDEPERSYSRRENELALGAASVLTVALFDRFSFEAGVRGVRVFTSTPIDLVHVTAGFRYRFSAPEWLPELMR